MPARSHPEPADTRTGAYTRRLASLEGARWKQVLDVQRPYRWNLRRLHLGRTLDVGCGLGRNLAALAPGSVGVDHNPESVALARSRGLAAMIPEELEASGAPGADPFDSLLFAHVIEHMDEPAGRRLVATYLRWLRPGGTVAFICPQERGYASDETHVRFVDLADLARLAADVGLEAVRRYSFPLPRLAGRLFTYNEFVLLARLSPPGADGAAG
ncbi:MAG: class I SAM-dependent methyltransferase [Acidimicrobiales bacterium]